MITQKHPQRHRTRNTACPALQGYAGEMRLLTGTADRAGALLALALLGVTLTLSGCSSGLVGGAQSNGDPGGRGLEQLRGDSVFGSVPPDASAAAGRDARDAPSGGGLTGAATTPRQSLTGPDERFGAGASSPSTTS